MHLENISLLNFKNYEELQMGFSEQINCFVGQNGSGKTNLLDAIHYLSLTKSAFNSLDNQNILHQAPFFMIQGTFSKQQEHVPVHCSLKKGEKKVFKHSKKTYERLSEHIGKFPVVMIAPNDTDIIREGSEMRRKFFDSIISQIDQEYLRKLLHYNHILKQRNSLLKQFAEQRFFDGDLLSTYDDQLLKTAEFIYHKRAEFLIDFLPYFYEHYQNLSENKEEVSLRYASDMQQEDFREVFEQSRQKDLILQRTSRGIHRDDYKFGIEGHSLKKFGSQGQQKSFLIALKLAQFDIIKAQKGFKPILLLDDIFDKLDDRRIAKLMEMVAHHTFGQLFVTDARPERSEAIFEQIEAEVKVFMIEKGQVIEEKMINSTKE
jgi:DNA replication and repair protein RecF